MRQNDSYPTEKQSFTGLPIYAYARFSSNKQASGSSERRQETDAEEWCRINGIDSNSVTKLVDRGKSGFHAENLKITSALGGFLKGIESGTVPSDAVLLIEALDRLTRIAVDEAAKLLLDLISTGISVVTLHDGSIYKKPLDLGEIVTAVTALDAANAFSRRLSRRIERSWKIKRDDAEKGLAVEPHGAAPAWLQKVPNPSTGVNIWIPIPDRVQIIEHIFLRRKEGATAHQIAKELNVKGVPPFQTARGKGYGWHAATIRSYFLSRTVLGEYQPRTTRTKNGKRLRGDTIGNPILNYYPQIISTDLWASTRPLQPAVAKKGRQAIDHEGNLFKVPVINADAEILNYRRKSWKSRHYEYFIPRIANLRGETRGKNFDYKAFEKAFLAFFKEADWNAFIFSVPRKHKSDELDVLAQEIADGEKQQRNFADAIGLGGNIPLLLERLRKVQQKLAQAKRRREELENAKTTSRPDDFTATTAEQRRALRTAIGSVVERITLYPRNKAPESAELISGGNALFYAKIEFKTKSVRDIAIMDFGYLALEAKEGDADTLLLRGTRRR